MIDDIKFDKEKLKKNFIDINNILNFKFLKCYKMVFKRKNIILNYGFYIMDFIFILFLICLFLFYYKYYHSFFDKVKKFVLSLNKNKIEHMNTSNKNIGDSNQIIDSGKENIMKLRINNNKKINFENKKNNFLEKQNKTEIYDKSKSKNDLFYIINKNEIKNINDNNILDHTDLELNSLSYEEALNYDNRSFIQIIIIIIFILSK